MMAKFHYKALDSRGKKRQGDVVAESTQAASTMLQQQNLVLLALTQTAKKEAKGSFLVPRRSISSKQLVMLTQQLATLIGASLPLDDALQVLLCQSTNGAVRNVLHALQDSIESGHSLGAALAQWPTVFAPAYVASVTAGEKSGQLSEVLQRLAGYTQRMQQTRIKIQTALIYPAIILLVTIAVIVVLLTQVLPQVVEVIVRMDQEIPLLTQVLIAISQFVTHWYWWLLSSLFILCLLVRAGLGNASIRRRFDAAVLTLPGLGALLGIYAAARFGKTLALISVSGVSIVEAISVARRVVTNRYIAGHIDEACQQIGEGSDFLSAFAQRPVFPSVALYLIASGQSNGQLPYMLDQAANDLEQQLENRVNVLLALIEPLMMLVMGGIVMLIVLAVMIPILDMNQLAL